MVGVSTIRSEYDTVSLIVWACCFTIDLSFHFPDGNKIVNFTVLDGKKNIRIV